MKKIITIILFLMFSSVFCQDFTFDNYYEYESENRIDFFMVNSFDNSYAFYGYNTEIGLAGSIINFQKNEFHDYTITNTDGNLIFTYINSRKKNKGFYNEKKNNVIYKFSSENIDSLRTKTTVIKNRKLKNGKLKIEGKANIEYEKSDLMFSSDLLKFVGHNFFDDRDVSFFGNELPSKITYEYSDVSIPSKNLTRKLKINALLSLNKKDILLRK